MIHGPCGLLLLGDGGVAFACGRARAPAGAAGGRVSGWCCRGQAVEGQAGLGIAAIVLNTATMAVAHGHASGILTRRRRPLRVSRAATCRKR